MKYTIKCKYDKIVHSTLKFVENTFTTNIVKDSMDEIIEEVERIANSIINNEPYDDADIQEIIDMVAESKKRFKLEYKSNFISDTICSVYPLVHNKVSFTDTPRIFIFIEKIK